MRIPPSHPRPRLHAAGFTLGRLVLAATPPLSAFAILVVALWRAPLKELLPETRRIHATKSFVKVLTVALEIRLTHDAPFPVDGDGHAQATGSLKVVTDGSSPLIGALTGSGDTSRLLDRRPIEFMRFPPHTPGSSGIIAAAGGPHPFPALLDPWGQPYVILMDTNGDHQIANPDAANADPKISDNAPPSLNASTLIYSAGPDKVTLTRDDITSWR